MPEEKVDLRQTLIAEAKALLAQGTADISLRHVARAAGVSAMAPYRHFADKAALLGAVAEDGFEALRVDLEQADALAEGRAALIEQGLAYIAFAQRNPHLFRLMFAGADLVFSAAKSDMNDTAFGVLSRRVAALATDQREAWTIGCWSIVHGMATLLLDDRIAIDTTQMRAVLTLVMKP